MKAFLSHSSVDQDFVRAVAVKLKKQRSIYDEFSFTSGEDIKKAIETGLNNSSIFVFFASNASLKSNWVDFEIDEASHLKIYSIIKKTLVYIIDPKITQNQIPNWLTKSIIKYENSPQLIADDIKFHLDELLRDRQSHVFIGRNEEMTQLENDLNSIERVIPPQVFLVSGLPGVGRKTFVKKISEKTLGFKKSAEIRIGEGDSLKEICISFANHVGPYSTNEGLKQIIDKIMEFTDEDVIKHIIDYIRALNENSEIPILIDDGGILDSEGYIKNNILTIIRSISPDSNNYMSIVTSSRPRNIRDISIPNIQLKPMKDEEISQLLKKLAIKESLQIELRKIRELSEFVAGYPPLALYAIDQVKTIGIDLVVRSDRE